MNLSKFLKENRILLVGIIFSIATYLTFILTGINPIQPTYRFITGYNDYYFDSLLTALLVLLIFASLHFYVGQKTKTNALRHSEAAFRLAFENAKDAILWADPATGLIIRCNKSAEILFDKKRGEILGHHQTTIHPPQKAEIYVEMFKKHLEEKGAIDDEAEVITGSGETKLVHITASVTIVGGKPVMQGIFRDITERKRAEETLRESEQRYRQLADSLPEIVFEADEKGNVTFSNKRAFEILGYTPDDLEHLNIFQFLVPEDRVKAKEEIRKMTERNESGSNEYMFLKKDGSTFPGLAFSELFVRGDGTRGLYEESS